MLQVEEKIYRIDGADGQPLRYDELAANLAGLPRDEAERMVSIAVSAMS